MATHSSILAQRISWTEEPGRLQSTGLQGVRHDLVTEHACTPHMVLGTQQDINRFKSLWRSGQRAMCYITAGPATGWSTLGGSGLSTFEGCQENRIHTRSWREGLQYSFPTPQACTMFLSMISRWFRSVLKSLHLPNAHLPKGVLKDRHTHSREK